MSKSLIEVLFVFAGLAYLGGMATWVWVLWVGWQFIRGKRSHEVNYHYTEE